MLVELLGLASVLGASLADSERWRRALPSTRALVTGVATHDLFFDGSCLSLEPERWSSPEAQAALLDLHWSLRGKLKVSIYISSTLKSECLPYIVTLSGPMGKARDGEWMYLYSIAFPTHSLPPYGEVPQWVHESRRDSFKACREAIQSDLGLTKVGDRSCLAGTNCQIGLHTSASVRDVIFHLVRDFGDDLITARTKEEQLKEALEKIRPDLSRPDDDHGFEGVGS